MRNKNSLSAADFKSLPLPSWRKLGCSRCAQFFQVEEPFCHKSQTVTTLLMFMLMMLMFMFMKMFMLMYIQCNMHTQHVRAHTRMPADLST